MCKCQLCKNSASHTLLAALSFNPTVVVVVQPQLNCDLKEAAAAAAECSADWKPLNNDGFT